VYTFCPLGYKKLLIGVFSSTGVIKRNHRYFGLRDVEVRPNPRRWIARWIPIRLDGAVDLIQADGCSV